MILASHVTQTSHYANCMEPQDILRILLYVLTGLAQKGKLVICTFLHHLCKQLLGLIILKSIIFDWQPMTFDVSPEILIK